MSTPSDSPPYSIFWPLQFLVACLGIGMGFHLFELNRDKLVTEREIHRLSPRGMEAVAAKNRLASLVKEINLLAGKDAVAAQLLADFKIQVQPETVTPVGGT